MTIAMTVREWEENPYRYVTRKGEATVLGEEDGKNVLVNVELIPEQ